MKKLLLSFILILLTTFSSFAQGFTNYKAVISDDSGNVLSNQTVTVRFTIYNNDPSSSGVQVFQETQTTTTDANGIVILNIGEENPMDWFAIDWSIPRQYLQTEYDTGSGFVDMGAQVLNSVPYAEFAFKSQNSIYAEQASEVDFSNITNVPAGLSDGDDDTQLTEAQVDSYVANNGYLTSEVDGDVTNEIQNLSLNTNELSISDGNTISFDNWDTDVTDDVTALDDLSDSRTTSFSVYIGSGSGPVVDSGEYNTALGSYSLRYVSSGSYNTAIGRSSLYNITTGYYNTAVGTNALSQISTTSDNTAIGYSAGQNATGSGNVFIGNKAGQNAVGDNNLYIANTNTETPLIYGDFENSELIINGAISILDGTEEGGRVLTCDNNGRATWQTPADQTDADFYKIETTEFSTDINDDIYHLGGLVLGADSFSSLIKGKLEINPSNSEYVLSMQRTTDVSGSLIGNIKQETEYNGDYHFIDYYSNITGVSSGEIHGVYLNISNTSDEKQTGVKNYIQSVGSGLRIGVDNTITYGTGEVKGVYNDIQSPGDGEHYGTHNILSGSGNGKQIGTQNQMFATGTGELTGTENIVDNNNTSATGDQIGTKNYLKTYGDNKQYGIHNTLVTNGTGEKSGSYNYLIGYGTGTEYGTYNKLEKITSVSGTQFGSYNYISGSGTGEKYGLYAAIDENAGGTHYAVYATALKTNSYAGYFLGDTRFEGPMTLYPKAFGEDATLTIESSSGAQLFIKSSGSNRPSTQYYLDNAYKTSTGYNIDQDAFFIYHANHNVFIKDGSILPDAHISRDLGASGTAWNNVYAHNYVVQGSAAYTDRKVTDEILSYPPIAKKDGDFDAKFDGLYELNPQSLPKNLHTENGLKIDEIATYNYKANYEQQKQINELKKLVKKQQKMIDLLLKKLDEK